MKKTCIQCNKEFDTKRKTSKFCSRECLYESRRVKHKKVCVVCGKSFIARKKSQKFCSLKCSSKNQESVSGIHKKRLHRIWTCMKNRCYNANSLLAYKYYGARGIKVCEQWKNSFLVFYEWSLNNGYQEDLTLDRLDYDNDYTPENCRWATKEQQANNKRNNKRITYNNETHTIGKWARIKNLSWDVLNWRIQHAWDIETALNTPSLGTAKERALRLRNED